MEKHENQEMITQYTVVHNQEGQYSIWPTEIEIPKGWIKVDKIGSKQECLTYIKLKWIDMRPLSIRSNVNTGAPKIITKSNQILKNNTVNFDERHAIYP